MEQLRNGSNSQMFILALGLVAATLVGSYVLSQGAMKVMRFSKETITVTGSANKDIRSDLIVWTGRFSRRDPDQKVAYQALQTDLLKVRHYLTAKGIDAAQILASQITSETLYERNEQGQDTNVISGFRLSQLVEVSSRDVEKVAAIAREITELINQGVQLDSYAPQYYYTQLDGLKLEMLRLATENAKQRAEQMAQAAGNKVGLLRSAKMGVFQITPVNSTEVSDWGVNDTSSLDKKVTAVVNASFAIE